MRVRGVADCDGSKFGEECQGGMENQRTAPVTGSWALRVAGYSGRDFPCSPDLRLDYLFVRPRFLSAGPVSILKSRAIMHVRS